MHWKLLLSLLLAVVSFDVADARRVAEVRAAAALEISVPEAVAILIKDGLYDLCAEFLHKPVYAKTSTVFATVTSNHVISVTTTAASKKTVTKGTVLVTVTKIVTATTTNFFYTETDDFYSFSISTTTTRTTAVGATTIYTNKVKKPRDDSEALHDRDAPFPSALHKFPSIISSACSSLLAHHTKTTTSTATSTHILTSTSTSTLTTTVPAHTVTKPKTSTTTTTQQLLSIVSIIHPLTATTTLSLTIYTSTTLISSQCAPTAYVGNALEYSDTPDIHFDLTVPDQASTIACCELCVNRPDCQVWIFYSQMVAFGRCLLVTGTEAGVCPDAGVNSGFAPPVCVAHTGGGVDIGFGACGSRIMITNPMAPDGCILGEN